MRMLIEMTNKCDGCDDLYRADRDNIKCERCDGDKMTVGCKHNLYWDGYEYWRAVNE